MSVRSVGFLALHSCPLLALGEGKAGGMSAYLLGLAREFRRRGIAVKIITNEHPQEHEKGRHDARKDVLHLPAPTSSAHSRGFVGAASAQTEEIVTALGDVDVIHSHYWLSGLAGLEATRQLRVPHVTTFHTIQAVKVDFSADVRGRHTQRARAEETIAQNVDGIVAWTRFEADALASRLGADPRHISVAPISVDTERFRPRDKNDARARLGIREEEEALLYVGRLDPIKGADVLLRAIGLLSTRPTLTLRIIGGDVDASFSSTLRQLVADLGIEEKVRWLGMVPNEALPSHYAAADALIVPSHSESFSIVAAEAMASGTPVVASNVPGPASFIQDGVSGRLVPPGDPPAFAAAIADLLDNDDLRLRLSDGALAAAQTLSWQASADTVLRLYDTVILETGHQSTIGNPQLVGASGG